MLHVNIDRISVAVDRNNQEVMSVTKLNLMHKWRLKDSKIKKSHRVGVEESR